MKSCILISEAPKIIVGSHMPSGSPTSLDMVLVIVLLWMNVLWLTVTLLDSANDMLRSSVDSVEPRYLGL